MKLITKKIENDFAKVGRQDTVADPIVIAKLFYGSKTWFLTEYDAETGCFFGLLFTGHDEELGYSNRAEFEACRLVERDMYFSAKPLSEARAEMMRQMGM